MREESDNPSRAPLVIVVIGCLLAAALAWAFWPRSEPHGGEEGFEAFEADSAPLDGQAGSSPDAARPEPDAARQRQGEGEGSVVVLEDRLARSGSESSRRAAAIDGVDAGEERRSDGGGYVDPINDQVLGPGSWMAELPEEERERMDEELDEPAPRQFPVDLGVRREGVEVAKAVVFDCYDALRRREPGRTGRVIVSFDVVANGSHATLRNAAVPTNVKLDDPQFETCIVEGINGLRVPATDEGQMHVEYPFLFDLEGKR